MRNSLLSKFFLGVLIAAVIPVNAADYIYSKLQMKSYDEMVTEVKARVQKAERVASEDNDEAKKILKDALQLIFSRPNRDNMVSELTPIVRTPLKNLDAYEDTISEIATETLAKIKSKNDSPASRATDLIVLENIMSEMRPDVHSNETVKNIFKKIRDSKVKVSDDVKNELRMRSALKPMAAPSEVAAKVLSSKKN